MKLKSLTFQNFQRFGAVPTTIRFDKPGTTIILGKNLDNTSNGEGSNGVGKSTIINALTYGLYDKPLSDVNLDELVNNVNKSKMEVIVEWEKGGVDYIVKRQRKMKAGSAGNDVFFFKNGVDISRDVPNTNTAIEEAIGIPYELFIRIVAFSAENVSFFRLPSRHASAPNQTDIIEELFNLKALSQKAELLKKKIKETTGFLEQHLIMKDVAEKELERHGKLLDTTQVKVVTWEQNHVKDIQKAKQKIDDIGAIDFKDQLNLLFIYEQKQKDVNKIIDNNKVLTQIKTDNTNNKNKAVSELAHLKDSKCPYCLQHFSKTKEKIEQCNLIILQANKELAKCIDVLSKSKELFKETNKEIESLESNLHAKSRDGLTNLENQVSILKERVKELEIEVNPHAETMFELEAVKIEKPDTTKINELQSLLDHQQFLLKLLTKKDSFVRKALLNKNIPFLNKRLQAYLGDLGLPYTVEFTHDMTASISYMGRIQSYGSLSNGQRSRVNLALSFAFRDVLQMMHDHINVCMLDEVLDVGLDGIGVTMAARMLKRKARDEKLSLYIISHRDEIDSAFDHKLSVQYSGGFSSVVE